MIKILKMYGYTDYEVGQYLYFHNLNSYQAGDVMSEYMGLVNV